MSSPTFHRPSTAVRNEPSAEQRARPVPRCRVKIAAMTSTLSLVGATVLTACGGGDDDLGLQATERVQSTASSDTPSGGTAPAFLGVSSAPHVSNQARARLAFASQQWGNIQCGGSLKATKDIPESGIHGATLPGSQSLRFGRVADNTTASGVAYQITLTPTDPQTAGSHRCELAFAADSVSGIPRDTTFWHAFSVKLPDWRGTTDEQAIAQWHAGDRSGGLLPIYTLLVRGNVMRLLVRHDSSATPSRSTAVATVVWSTSDWKANTWLNFVTQALVSPDVNRGPFIKTWLNGAEIVNYQGPVGYNQPTVQSYAKHGIYHWVDSTNQWDMSLPTRTLRLKRPLIVRDPAGEFDHTRIESLLNED